MADPLGDMDLRIGCPPAKWIPERERPATDPMHAARLLREAIGDNCRRITMTQKQIDTLWRVVDFLEAMPKADVPQPESTVSGRGFPADIEYRFDQPKYSDHEPSRRNDF
jgi:hypothetical protein